MCLFRSFRIRCKNAVYLHFMVLGMSLCISIAVCEKLLPDRFKYKNSFLTHEFEILIKKVTLQPRTQGFLPSFHGYARPFGKHGAKQREE